MKYSYKLKLNKQRIRLDDTAALYFQVIINSKRTMIPLHLYWSHVHFDEEKSEILPRQRNDALHEDYSRMIARKSNEINEVFIWARLANVELTIETFLRELANQASRFDFCAFWDTCMNDRKARGIISENTYRSNKSSLGTLKEYRAELPFTELTKKFLEDYKAWMFRQDLTGNTVWKKLKEMRTYTLLASEAGYFFEYPFKGFKLPTLVGRVEHLNEEEFLTLKKHFYSANCPDTHKVTLRAFLFACYTGLRISDLMAVSWKEVRKDVLIFRPKKRPRDMIDTVSVPLHPQALKLIPNKKGVLIPTHTEQSMNRMIKTIAGKLELNPNITFHWARHTFATRFLRHGGRIEVLQQLLGHKKIETTMIYVHVDDERKRREIGLIPE